MMRASMRWLLVSAAALLLLPAGAAARRPRLPSQIPSLGALKPDRVAVIVDTSEATSGPMNHLRDAVAGFFDVLTAVRRHAQGAFACSISAVSLRFARSYTRSCSPFTKLHGLSAILTDGTRKDRP
jgi:hypothetical protein